MSIRGTLWTLDELGARAAVALSIDYSGPSNGRVRSVPDRRTIRYYTTLGLLDAPSEMRGRTALYSEKHLCQLVAIKRLQSQGLSLKEVQTQLVGLSERALRKLAKLPENEARQEVDQGPSERDETFWKTPPVKVGEEEQTSEEVSGIRQMSAVPLVEGLTLLLDARRPLEDHDLEAIRVAAEPLLKLLRTRQLLRSDEDSSKKE